MLRVTPLYGSSGHHPSSTSVSLPPSSTLIEYGGVRVLVNVGWDEGFAPLGDDDVAEGTAPPSGEGGADQPPDVPPKDLPEIDVVLITDSTLSALGGLPVYYGSSSRRRRRRKDSSDDDGQPAVPPIYGTYPTVKMGQMTLYDHHANSSLDGGTPGYSLEDVDALFSPTSRIGFRTLKYSQTLTLTDTGRVYDPSSSSSSDPSAGKAALGITGHRAGHVSGGTFWVLRRLADETEVVVAPVYHHARERHLNSATLHKFGAAADVLITRPGGPGGLLGRLYAPPLPGAGGGKKMKAVLTAPSVGRDEGEFVETAMAALRRGGNVLCPVDASGRVLELLLVLNGHWERHRLGSAYNLCWVGPMAWNTAEFARSQLEWMSSPLGAQFDSGRGHPFALRSVSICSTVAELDAIVEASGGNPTLALASGATLDSGPARDLLLRWGENQDNAVVLTDSSRCVLRGDVAASRRAVSRGKKAAGGGAAEAAKSAAAAAEDEAEGGVANLAGSAMPPEEASVYSAAAQLLLEWCESKQSGEEMADVVFVDVPVPRRAPLAGRELQDFLAEEERARREKKREEERAAMLREVELAKGRLRLGEEEAGGKAPAVNAATAASAGKAKAGPAAGAAQPPKKKSRFDSTLFLKFSKPLHMTFEVREEAVGIGQSDSVAKYGIGESIGRSGEVLEDDYGISVVPERFVDIVTGVDPSKFAGGTGRIGEDVLRRGLGFGADGRPVLTSTGGGLPVVPGQGKDGTEDAEGMQDEEQALEASDLSEGKGIIRGRNGRPPIKVSTLPRKLEVLAEVVYIPLEGRVDARAARQSVRALQPRQVVILGGGRPSGVEEFDRVAKDESEEFRIAGEAGLLADAVRSLTVGKEKGSIFAPADGATIELSVGHAAYSVRLIDTPYVSREEREAAAGKDLEADDPLEPFEAKMGECSVSLLNCVATGQKVALDGSIVLAPRAGSEQQHRPNVMISDGDVLLTDLRSEVIAQGMKAEYSAHSGYSQLIVNGKIIVRKDQATGKIDVEGPLCEDFFTVRSVVCGQYVAL